MTDYIVKIDTSQCKGCHLCAHFCKFGVLGKEDEVNSQGYFSAEVKDTEKCKGCGFCYLVCPDCAIKVVKKEDAEED